MYKRYVLLFATCMVIPALARSRHQRVDGEQLMQQFRKLEEYAHYSVQELKAQSETIYRLIKQLMQAATQPDKVSQEQRKQIMNAIKKYKVAERKTLAQSHI